MSSAKRVLIATEGILTFVILVFLSLTLVRRYWPDPRVAETLKGLKIQRRDPRMEEVRLAELQAVQKASPKSLKMPVLVAATLYYDYPKDNWAYLAFYYVCEAAKLDGLRFLGSVGEQTDFPVHDDLMNHSPGLLLGEGRVVVEKPLGFKPNRCLLLRGGRPVSNEVVIVGVSCKPP